ncbi:phasin family protein [Hansschlegelia zhihuaiae]|uniref:Phasin n=1 Tax=Hansschlegelia zhihuaiae TaxID=405005 RepID=A0A4Q0MJT2_9HYPH|nr:phasin family protein [Hansschlegelia zhihuaiae]RXF73663.1 phasin [Hansschlegelia zhihuaiae]
MTNAKDAAKTEDTVETLRGFAQKGVDQAQQSATQMRDAAANAASHMQDAAAKSAKGYRDLGLKSVEIARANLNTHFDFLDALFKAKSVNQAVELQASYARQQFDVMGGQVQELSAIAQKALAEGSKPFQDLGSKAVRSAQSAR